MEQVLKKKRTHAIFWRLLREVPNYNEAFKDDIKSGVVMQYSQGRTASLSEMWQKYPAEYSRMIDALKGDSQRKQMRYMDDADISRKRVIAAICGYLDKVNVKFATRDEKVRYAISVACRSANCASFNKIPLSKLDALYQMFRKKQEVNVDWNPAINYRISNN